MCEFFAGNDLISHNQVGLKRSDSRFNQLVSITHETYNSFDDGLDVPGVFLDISKAFDNVWHKGLLYKLKQNVISSNLLDTTTESYTIIILSLY